MEEETSEEWKIEKHEGGGSSKRSLIFRVGKKIVITGVVISSAPFLLPPLIVVSTVGFAFSVPFGLLFASYACTEKVMSKLLSRPMIERIEGGEEEEDGMEREEEEFEDDMKKRLEMRIELIGDESGAGEENQFGVFEEEQRQDMGEVTEGMRYKEDYDAEEDVKGMIEDKGDEGIVIEDLVGGIGDEVENDKLVREVNGFQGDETIEQREVPLEETFESIEENEEPVKDTNGFVQEYRGEDNVERTMEEEEMPVSEHFVIIEEEEKPLKQDKEMIEGEEEVNIPVEETIENTEEENKLTGESASDGEETRGAYILGKSVGVEEVSIEEVEQHLEGKGNAVKYHIPIQEEKPLEGIVEGSEENGYKENGVLDEKPEPKEKTPLIEKREVKVISTKENAREITDESGLHLFDDETATPKTFISGMDETREPMKTYNSYYSQSFEVGFEPVSSELSSAVEEHSSDKTYAEHSSDKTYAERVDYDVRRIPSERAETKPAKSASEMETTISSKEVLYSEKKIWELLDAMRKIVGYKAAVQPKLSEELKALYLFTGVEPPLSFKDPLDLVEVNDKVRLLMAIIGVK